MVGCVAIGKRAPEIFSTYVRRSCAASLTVRCRDELEVRIVDDGTADDAWLPGVGLSGMRQRIDELGGRLEAGPDGSGGRVVATFPMVSS